MFQFTILGKNPEPQLLALYGRRRGEKHAW